LPLLRLLRNCLRRIDGDLRSWTPSDQNLGSRPDNIPGPFWRWSNFGVWVRGFSRTGQDYDVLMAIDT
jgi:hypothetical protein